MTEWSDVCCCPATESCLQAAGQHLQQCQGRTRHGVVLQRHLALLQVLFEPGSSSRSGVPGQHTSCAQRVAGWKVTPHQHLHPAALLRLTHPASALAGCSSGSRVTAVVRPSSSLRPKLLLLPSTWLCCGRGDEQHLSGGNCARACLLLHCREQEDRDPT